MVSSANRPLVAETRLIAAKAADAEDDPRLRLKQPTSIKLFVKIFEEKCWPVIYEMKDRVMIGDF